MLAGSDGVYITMAVMFIRVALLRLAVQFNATVTHSKDFGGQIVYLIAFKARARCTVMSMWRRVSTPSATFFFAQIFLSRVRLYAIIEENRMNA